MASSPDNESADSDSIQNLKTEIDHFLLQYVEIQKIELTTVRGTRLRFPEANQAAPSFCPDSGTKATFDKPFTSPPDLIPILESRGLIIHQPAEAIRWLEKIGYYRLSGYGLQYRLRDSTGKLIDHFSPGTRFEDLTDLYEFDRHLRLLVLDAIERIEVAFRSRMNDTLASLHGPHWFLDPSRFSDKRDEKTNNLIFDHQEFLVKAEEEARRNKESLFIRHYFKEYGSPVLPPCWMLAEALSMGTWSKAYGILAERSDQKPVADFFRASPPELISWIHALTNLRNTCAHHSRLWDRRFVTCPSRKGNLKTAVTNNDRLFAQIAACLYCLWSVEPTSHWFARLQSLIGQHPNLPIEAMGFPADWEDRLLTLRPSADR